MDYVPDSLPRTIAALLLSLASACTAHAATILVGGDGAACDFATIQPAIDAAAANPGPDTIQVATNATYTAQALRMNTQDVEIVGGFANCASATPAPGARTTISGFGGAADSVIVILGGGHRTLRNFLITAGDETNDGTGGGIDFQGTGQLTLQSVIVSQNHAGFGGGISFDALSPGAVLTLLGDVVVQNNVADGSGGGIRLSGEARMTMSGPRSTLTGNEALGNAGASGFGGGLQIVGSSRAEISSPGFGAIGAIASNRAKFGGGIALVPRSSGDSLELSALLYTTDPLHPVRVHDNVASVRGGGAFLGARLDGGDLGVGVLCAWDFRIDGNRAPDGAALYLDSSEGGEVGAFGFLNTTGGCDAPPPSASGCAGGVPCNSIDGNLVQQANGQPATGPVVSLRKNASIAARRVAFVGNVGNDLIQTPAQQTANLHIGVSECLMADNALTARLIAGNRVRIANCTMAGNSLGFGSAMLVTTELDIRDSIVWQPGFAAVLGAAPVVVGANVLTNDPSSFPFPGVTGAAPRFIDPPRSDYRLRAASPAIDFSPAVAGDDRDLDGRPRDQDLPIAPNLFGTRDLGAFERPALLPLELNGTFDGDLNQWTEATAGATRFDATQDVSGPAGSGVLEVDWTNTPVVLGSVVGRVQCIHLPGPGTYRLNGFARTSGGLPPLNVQVAQLHWEFRRTGTEACTSGAPDRAGDHVITSGTSFVQPSSPTAIAISPSEWTPESSIAISTVVRSAGTTASPRLHAWFDGIALKVDVAPTDALFADGFE